MKKVMALIITVLLIMSSVFVSNAAAIEQPYSTAVSETQEISIPKIEITTENGNGAQLQKADGYVNAEIKITDADGSALDETVLFKVRGNSTALSGIQKKSFTFKFDKKKEVLGMGKGKKWALLANCFDPTLLRNYLVFDFAQEMELPYTSNQRFAELWLDGAYRGCYTVYEPVQEGKDRVDIDIESNEGKKDFLLEYEATRVEDGVTYITAGGLRFALQEPEEPGEEQTAYVNEVMTDIVNTLKYGSEEDVRQKIDVDSFAKFYLLNEYAKTNDFGLSSVFFFYKDGILYAGPPWDYDLSLGNVNGELNSASAKAASKSDGILQDSRNFYRWLCDKEWFTSEVKRFYYKYYPYIENISADGGKLDSLREQYADLFARNFKVWDVKRWWLNYQKVPYSTYDENYDFLKNWCAERNAWLTDYYGIIPGAVLIGDADDNGKVNIDDAAAVQKVLAKFSVSPFNETAADIDGDGLSITDVTLIQRYLAGYENPYQIGEYVKRK